MSVLLSSLKDCIILIYTLFAIFSFLPCCNWQNLLNLLTNFNVKEREELYSSVFCRGNNHTDRICRFKNLCYDSILKEFIFFHNHNSDVVGLPQDRFSPALVDFSSVYDHNTQYFNFVDLPSSSLSNFNSKLLEGTAIIFKRFNPENLMHLFHDDLIPAYVTLKENFLLSEQSNVYFVFADGREPGPYSYLYENFLDRLPIYLNKVSSQFVCFANAVVGLNKHSVWYQYGFKEPQGPLHKDMLSLSLTLTNFCAYFRMKFQLDEISSTNSAVLLTRKYNRKILNAEDVARAVEKITNFKTYIMSLEEYSILDIIKRVMTCQFLIGVHGSLLILSVFLPPKSQIIEIFPYAINPTITTPYKTLAGIPGLELTYYSWENKRKENTIPHPEYPPELGGIMHLPKQIQEEIKSSAVEPFLCCYNPQWLYRIYQDTIVDIQSFSALVDKVYKEKPVHITNEDFISSRLYPSEVQNISCTVNSENIYVISWEKPWNLEFMNMSVVEYELWYQTFEESDIRAFIMKRRFFALSQNITDAYFWVRCHVDGKIGPFNINPFICEMN